MHAFLSSLASICQFGRLIRLIILIQNKTLTEWQSLGNPDNAEKGVTPVMKQLMAITTRINFYDPPFPSQDKKLKISAIFQDFYSAKVLFRVFLFTHSWGAARYGN